MRENQLRQAVNKKKDQLIDILIKKGIYKKQDKHLYNLTLSDLENEYNRLQQNDIADHIT